MEPGRRTVSCLAHDFGGLSLRGRTFVEYVWLGGSALDLRSKSRVLSRAISRLEDVPWTAVDGALTGQAGQGGCATVYLKPRALFKDPFRAREGADAYLVLCDTFSPPVGLESGALGAGAGGNGGPGDQPEWEPHPSNNRAFCESIMDEAVFWDPWFSCEQQYTLYDARTQLPLGSLDSSQGAPPQPTCSSGGCGSSGYCGLGSGLAEARDFAEAHMMACLHAGVKVTGMHAQAPPGRWCYELGTLQGLDFGDQLWASRYILHKLAERSHLLACLEPRPLAPGAACGCPEDMGPGVLVRYSTRETREDGCGWHAIQKHVQRLEANHRQHMLVYGTGNTQRMQCPAAASCLGRFTVAVESTSASVRVPHSVMLEHKGFYEDRRPAGNMDPYLVSLMLVCTTCGIPLPTHPGAGATPHAAAAAQHAFREQQAATRARAQQAQQAASCSSSARPAERPGAAAVGANGALATLFEEVQQPLPFQQPFQQQQQQLFPQQQPFAQQEQQQQQQSFLQQQQQQPFPQQQQQQPFPQQQQPFPQQQQPWGPVATGTAGPAPSNLTGTSSSAILSELDVRRQQEAQQAQQAAAQQHAAAQQQAAQQAQRPLAGSLQAALMPETPDQMVALLRGTEGVVRGGVLLGAPMMR